MSHDRPSPQIFDEIDDSLRRAYEQLLNEDLPERFIELIDKLREKSLPSSISADDGGKDD